MISWNPRNDPGDRVTEDADQASTSAPEQTVQYPLGFANVRPTEATAPQAEELPRRPVGFAPARDLDTPRFRTEISFRREPRTMPVVHAEVGRHGLPLPELPSVGHAETWETEPRGVPSTPEAAADDTPAASAARTSEKVPFYKREISFRRRRGAQDAEAAPSSGSDELPGVDEADASEPEVEQDQVSRPFGFTGDPVDPVDEESANETAEPAVEAAGEPDEWVAPDPSSVELEETDLENEIDVEEPQAVEWVAPESAAPVELEETDLEDEPVEWAGPDPVAPPELEPEDEVELENQIELEEPQAVEWVAPESHAAVDADHRVEAPEGSDERDDVEEHNAWVEPEADASTVEVPAPDVDDVDEPDVWRDETLFPEDEGPVSEMPSDDADTAHDETPVATNGRRSLRGKRGGSKPTAKRERGRSSRGGRKVVGLKVGASQLAAAVVSDANGSHELLQLARTPLEAGVVVDGEVRDAVALTHALKAFFEEHKLPRRDVRIGLASNRIGVRTFDIVGIDDPERFDNAVRFKAHEVLPVAVHESVLDYRVIEERVSETGEPMRRVLLVVAPRDQVEPYVDVCREAGLKLAGVDLEALGLLRAFVEPRPFASRSADDTATVVVAIGHEATTLLVSGGGACEFTRVFDWGGGALQSAIAQELDVPLVEATTILRHLALSGTAKPLASLDDDSRVRALEAVRGRLTPFARELVSSLQFYQTQAESLGIGEIVITGGTAHLQGLGDALHQMIGVAVRVGDPLQRVVALTAVDSGIESSIGSMAVPIGLAIEDSAVRSVDLMPKELREQRKKPSIAAFAVPVAVAVPVAAMAFMFLQANGTVSDRESELGSVRTAISKLPKPKRPVIDPGVTTTEAQRAVALATVLGGRVSWDGVFRDLSLVLPGNVSLTRLAAQLPDQLTTPDPSQAAAAAAGAPTVPTGVEIEGYTDDQPSVARLLARLRTVPSLSNVQLESSARESVGSKLVVRFKILADITQSGGAQ